jgi:hypothetical protein
VRKIHIPNDVSPPFHFSALVPGLDVNKSRQPFRPEHAARSARQSRRRRVLAGARISPN